MFLIDLLFALMMALALTGIFTATVKRRGPWELWWGFLLVIFLGIWAGGLWFNPVIVGPAWLTISWLPALLIGIFLAILLAATTPSQPPRTRREQIAQEQAEENGLEYLFLGLCGRIGHLNHPGLSVKSVIRCRAYAVHNDKKEHLRL